MEHHEHGPSTPIATLLGQIPLFAELKKSELESLARQARIDHYQNGDAIFYQGDPGDRLWVVRQGRVKIVRHEEDGRDVILEIIPPGEVFGGGTIFLPENPGTAQALGQVETVSFSIQAYSQFIIAHPTVALNLLRMLGARLYSLMQMQVLAGERVERRLAHILLKLSTRAGRPHPDGVLISIPLSRQDLADMSGTTLETTIRTMSRLRAQGVVKTLRGGYLVILDIERLKVLAKA